MYEYLLSDLSDLPGVTFVNPGSKVPEDQTAIDELLQTKSGSDGSTLQTVVSDNNTVSSDQFISISLCCTMIICIFLVLSRR